MHTTGTDLDLLDQARAAFEPFLARLAAKPEVEGIVFLSSAARTGQRVTFDRESDLDLTVFLRTGMTPQEWRRDVRDTRALLADRLPRWLPNFSFHVPVPWGRVEINLHQRVFEHDADPRTSWDDPMREAHAYTAEVVFDRHGAVRTLLDDKTRMSEQERVDRLIRLSSRLLWDIRVLPERQVGRGDAAAGHYMLAGAVEELIEILFVLGAHFVPHRKWRLHDLRQYGLASEEDIDLLLAALRCAELTEAEFQRRVAALEQLWANVRPRLPASIPADVYHYYSANLSLNRQLRTTTVADEAQERHGEQLGDTVYDLVNFLLPDDLADLGGTPAQVTGPPDWAALEGELGRRVAAAPPSRTRGRVPATGVLWIGSVYGAGGYATASRAIVRGLRELGVPLRVVDLWQDDRAHLDGDTVAELDALCAGDPGSSPLAVLHSRPEMIPNLRIGGAARVALATVFETDRIPPTWPALCAGVDEVWVPTRFNQQTFSSAGIPADRLRLLPHGVDVGVYHPDAVPPPDRTDGRFRFLYVAHFDYRKGFDLLLQAYYREFTSRDPVTLVLKTGVGDGVWDFPADWKDRLAEMIHEMVPAPPDAPEVVIRTDRLSLTEMRELYRSCDLHVSTDRAQGWGMPGLEAMATGRAASAIDWSGNTQFMTAENSFPIPWTGRLVPIDPRLVAHRAVYRGGHRWAEVEVEAVRGVLRAAYRDRNRLDRIAASGLATAQGPYSHRSAAAHVVEELDRTTATSTTGWDLKVLRRPPGRPPTATTEGSG